MLEFLSIDAFAYIFCISFSICSILVLTKSWHIGASLRRGDSKAVQAAHVTPTPRIGGIGIVLGIVLSLVLLDARGSGGVASIFAFSLLPVFTAGLLEDFGFRVRPRERLVAAAVSGAIATAVLQVWVMRVDVPLVDLLFAFAPLAVAFTLFATAGICHAFNLIDGLNGLASATAAITAVGLAAIAVRAGQGQVAENALLLVAALLGFLVLNYPLGKIFLGDAGAYSIGHVLAWLAVVLMVRAPEVTPWAVVLVFFWPLADTCFAIYRRRKAGKSPGEPDRLHHHQLVMRGIEIMVLGRRSRQLANPLGTLVMLPMIASPVLVGAALWNRPFLACLAVVFFGSAFVTSYRLGVHFVARRRRRWLQRLPNSPVVYNQRRRATL